MPIHLGGIFVNDLVTDSDIKEADEKDIGEGSSNEMGIGSSKKRRADSSFQDEHNVINEEHEKLRRHCTKLEEEVGKLRDQAQLWKDRCTKLESEAKKLQASIQEWRKQSKKNELECNAAHKTALLSQRKTENLLEHLAPLKQNKAHLEHKLEESLALSNSHVEKIKALENIMAELRSELSVSRGFVNATNVGDTEDLTRPLSQISLEIDHIVYDIFRKSKLDVKKEAATFNILSPYLYRPELAINLSPFPLSIPVDEFLHVVLVDAIHWYIQTRILDVFSWEVLNTELQQTIKVLQEHVRNREPQSKYARWRVITYDSIPEMSAKERAQYVEDLVKEMWKIVEHIFALTPHPSELTTIQISSCNRFSKLLNKTMKWKKMVSSKYLASDYETTLTEVQDLEDEESISMLVPPGTLFNTPFFSFISEFGLTKKESVQTDSGTRVELVVETVVPTKGRSVYAVYAQEREN